MTVTSQPAAVASTRRAIESGPPDTAQATGMPRSGNAQRSSSGAAASSGARSGNGGAGGHPRQPALRRSDLLERGEVGRTFPAAIDGMRTGGGLDGGNELLAR